jgi:hypothetical protein
LLSRRLIAVNGGRDSALRHAFGRDGKGIVSIAAHVLAIGSALFYPIVSCVLYALVAAAWFLPDPRIELRMREA